MPIGWVAAAGVVSSYLGSSAASSAADSQSQASQAATALQGRVYDSTVARNAPFVTAGTQAETHLADLLGTSTNTKASGYGSLMKNFTMDDYLKNQDPSYQFALKQGQNALTSRSGVSGSSIGGAALKGLVGYNQDYASTGYNNAFDRYQVQQGNIFSRLSSLAGSGQASANNTSSAGTQFGAQAGSNLIGAGNAQAAGTIGSANAVAGGLSNAAGAYYMNSLKGSSGDPNYGLDSVDSSWADSYRVPTG